MPDEQHKLHLHETAFVDSFILPERRERYRLKLASPQNRRRFVDRLNHCCDIDPRYARLLDGGDDAVDALRRHGASTDCYVISSAMEIDGRTLPLAEAVSLAPLYGWGTIASCIPGRLAYYYDEGGARRMILQRTT